MVAISAVGFSTGIVKSKSSYWFFEKKDALKNVGSMKRVPMVDVS